MSLNQVLMQGPHLNNRFDEVLLRLRKESVTVVAVAGAMFYRVRVCQRNCFHVLWWWCDGAITEEAIAYRLKVHLFGATLSLSCAAFNLHQAVISNEQPD